MIFLGKGALLWRAVEFALAQGKRVDVVLTPDVEAVPTRAAHVERISSSGLDQGAGRLVERSTDGIVWSINNDVILREPLLKSGLRFFNVHNGLLPAYRGRAEIALVHAILNGEKEYGATLHRIDEGIDTGAILDVVRYPVPRDARFHDVMWLGLAACQTLFERNLSRVLAGDPPAIVQRGASRYHGRRDLGSLRDLAAHPRFSRATDLGVFADSFPELARAVASATASPEKSAVERRTGAATQAVSGAGDVSRSSLLDPISVHVARTPEALALACGDRRLSYRQLDGESERIAAILRARGIGAEDRVGIHLDRCVHLLPALLGTLKAGAAFVPLDPRLPEARMAAIVEDVEPSVVLTRRALLQTSPGRERVCVDEPSPPAPPSSASARPLRGDYLAYVLYTSGSTGRPKGVMVTRGAIENYLRWACETYDVASGRGAVVHSSFGFDATLTSLLCPLISGRAVFIVPEQDGFEAVGRILREQRGLSLLKFTTSQLDHLSAGLRGHDSRGCTRVIVQGGEALRGETVVPWRAGDPGVRIVNEYGPTEATVGCCIHEVAPGEDLSGDVPCGRPIDGCSIQLRDERLEPVPDGSPGEMYIGGVGLARGYFGSPGATAERFVPDPRAAEPGARMYRSGDRARRAPGGELEYLGRIDQQVKIRGCRVELGDVEAALHEHPGVGTVAVVARGVAGDKRLEAYFTAPGEAPSEEELRGFLLGRVPDYMVPARFAELTEMPVTANGKLDRGALPTITNSPYAAPRPPVRAHTAVEVALLAIFTEILRCPVGVDDDFLALGGDSIMAIQVAARAHQAGLVVTSYDVFALRSVARVAARARRGAGLVAVEQAPVTGPVPLTPIQRWFFERSVEPLASRYGQSLALELDPSLNAEHLARAWSSLHEHHDALRLRYARGEAGWEQRIVAPTEPPEPVLVKGLPGDERGLHALLAATADRLLGSLDLVGGPISGCAILERDDGTRWFLAIVHHLAVDGVSWRILVEDLAQLCRDEHAGLPARTTSFQEWARRLVEHERSERMARSLPFWADQAGLPVVFPGPPPPSGGPPGRVTVSTVLPAGRTDRLLREAPRCYGVEMLDLLVTALLLAFRSWLDRNSLVIDLEGHGRDGLPGSLDLSRTVGWFTAIHPILLRLPPRARGLEAVAAVRDQLREPRRRGVEYGLLRYGARGGHAKAVLESQVEAQVAFNYLGQLDALAGSWPFTAVLPELTGLRHPPGAFRRHALDVSGLVLGGKLRMSWDFDAQVLGVQAVQVLADMFDAHLRKLIEDAPSPAGWTGSADDLADLNAQEIERELGRSASEE
jgi:amino acid adenylation domain-containing protein/non-ribosomal peptide synthase protein (TIGR01720 family)